MRTIYVYADESGVFDNAHYDLYTFGGIILTSKAQRERQLMRYRKVEARIRRALGASAPPELKATLLEPQQKTRLFQATNIGMRFGAVISQNEVLHEIFKHKKNKQRYLDYVFLQSLKNGLESLIATAEISVNEPATLHIVMDEHSTATNGVYELRENLEQDFIRGSFNRTYTEHEPPLLPNLVTVDVQHANSSKTELVRAADIIANRLLWRAKNDKLQDERGITIASFPGASTL